MPRPSIDVRAVQPSKALEPSEVSAARPVNEAREEQSKKARVPMCVSAPRPGRAHGRHA